MSTTAGQNAAAGLGLSLILANMLNGPQRPALRGLITSPTGRGGNGGSGGGLGGLGDGGGLGGSPLNPFVPDIPLVPQGPVTGIPFSPISTGGRIGPWQAMLELGAEFAFVAVAVVAAADYPAAVVVFLTILWLLFLMNRTAHPWRSQRAAATPRSV